MCEIEAKYITLHECTVMFYKYFSLCETGLLIQVALLKQRKSLGPIKLID